jgi:hypothetical protein
VRRSKPLNTLNYVARKERRKWEDRYLDGYGTLKIFMQTEWRIEWTRERKKEG